MKKIYIVIIACLLLVNLFLIAEVINVKSFIDSESRTLVQNEINGFSSDLTEVIEEVRSGIVKINAEKNIGSGFIYATKKQTAYIITAYHVIENSDYVNVLLDNYVEFKAKVEGYDKKLDLAVLSINCNFSINSLSLANSELTKSGEFVLKFGHNNSDYFNIETSLMMVSNANYSTLLTIDKNPYYITLIECDRALNYGNSGGPIINMAGEVLGINLMSNSETDNSYILPSNHISLIANNIIEGNYKEPLDLGVKVLPIKLLSSYQKVSLDLKIDMLNGILIEEVQTDSLAFKLGVETSDIITHINGYEITDYSQLLKILYTEEKIDNIVIYRNGSEITINGVLND